MSNFFSTELSHPAFETEGLRFITVKSKALGRRADISVYIPATAAPEALVILLHGVYGSHWAWAFNGGVHRTTAALINENKIAPMILVMPSDGLYGDGSAYLPHQFANYEKWITEDLLQVVKEKIATVSDQLPVFITGLSMGGYGALRLGAKNPDIFSGFSGLSSITEFGQMKYFLENNDDTDLAKSVTSRESVLDCLLANRKNLAPFRFDCGSSDPLIAFNRKLHQDLLQHQVVHIYEEYAGGHEWTYWQQHITDSLLFFNGILKNKSAV
jgi:putative tributyrin esterase